MNTVAQWANAAQKVCPGVRGLLGQKFPNNKDILLIVCAREKGLPSANCSQSRYFL